MFTITFSFSCKLLYKWEGGQIKRKRNALWEVQKMHKRHGNQTKRISLWQLSVWLELVISHKISTAGRSLIYKMEMFFCTEAYCNKLFTCRSGRDKHVRRKHRLNNRIACKHGCGKNYVDQTDNLRDPPSIPRWNVTMVNFGDYCYCTISVRNSNVYIYFIRFMTLRYIYFSDMLCNKIYIK